MKHITGFDRYQAVLFPTTIDAVIPENALVRVIDLFVDTLNLQEMGFNNLQPPADGRPPYHPADLLKLYLYGYMNRYRSSRMLETEAKRNIELMWLLKGLTPDHNTISNFRRDNPKAIKKVFRQTVAIAKHHNLIGGVLIAGDSTKMRAQNSKKNNYNEKKIQRHLDYIDRKLEEHEKAMSEADNDPQKQDEIKQEISKHNQRKNGYKKLQKELKASGQEQISTTDPDSRHQIVRNNITEVCYTVQVTTDEKNRLPIDYKVTNQNDKKAMGNMLCRAKSILGKTGFTALYDKGYHTGSEFKTASQLGVNTLVAVPEIGRASQAPDPAYNAEKFMYNAQNDTYTCPQGYILTSNQTRYKARNYHFKQYKTKACRTCAVKSKCTTSKMNGKIVQRTEFAAYIEDNAISVSQQQETYKKRQSIVEHPFGTIKRQWGYDHVLTKRGRNRAEADVGMIFIAYNIRRLLSILGHDALKKWLKKIILHVLDKKKFLERFSAILSKLNFILNFYYRIFTVAQKGLIWAQKSGTVGGF